MKIKQKTRDKYARFLSLPRADEPRPLERIVQDESGHSAIDCFHALESRGEMMPCREAVLLERYLAGKAWHGVTVAMVAEEFAINRLVFSAEIKAWYPEWVAEEIFAQARKVARQKLGYVPTFVEKARDFSEREAGEMRNSVRTA